MPSNHAQIVAEHFADVVGVDGVVNVELSGLANGVGVSLRSVQRVIDQLRDEGVIEGARGSYRILNMVRMQSIARGDAIVQHDMSSDHRKPVRDSAPPTKTECDCATQLESLQGVLSSVVSEVTRLYEVLSGAIVEVVSLRAEVAALRADGVAVVDPKPSDLTLGRVLIRREGQPLTPANSQRIQAKK